MHLYLKSYYIVYVKQYVVNSSIKKCYLNMRHKNAQIQPLYCEILSKYHLFVVPVVIVYYQLDWCLFLLNRCHCTTPYFTGPLQYAFIHESIGTKNQHTTKTMLISIWVYWLHEKIEKKEKYTNIPLAHGRPVADYLQICALKSVAVTPNAIFSLHHL